MSNYARRSPGFSSRRRRSRSFRRSWDRLEERSLLSAFTAVPDHIVFQTAGGVIPDTAGPSGYSPAQIRHAYGFDQVNFGGVPGDGRGQTIAIVDAYDDPTIASDLTAFDTAFGLPAPPCFTKVNQNGGTQHPPPDPGWDQEMALDVEWAHADGRAKYPPR